MEFGTFSMEAAVDAARRGEPSETQEDAYWRGAHRTEVRGYEMRSLLEAKYALWLDQMGVQWTYEPQTFHANGLSYLPDFKTEARGHPLYVEVKPEWVAWKGLEHIQDKMETIWFTVPEAHLLIVTDQASKWLGKNGRWIGPERRPADAIEVESDAEELVA